MWVGDLTAKASSSGGYGGGAKALFFYLLGKERGVAPELRKGSVERCTEMINLYEERGWKGEAYNSFTLSFSVADSKIIEANPAILDELIESYEDSFLHGDRSNYATAWIVHRDKEGRIDVHGVIPNYHAGEDKQYKHFFGGSKVHRDMRSSWCELKNYEYGFESGRDTLQIDEDPYPRFADSKRYDPIKEKLTKIDGDVINAIKDDIITDFDDIEEFLKRQDGVESVERFGGKPLRLKFSLEGTDRANSRLNELQISDDFKSVKFRRGRNQDVDPRCREIEKSIQRELDNGCTDPKELKSILSAQEGVTIAKLEEKKPSRLRIKIEGHSKNYRFKSRKYQEGFDFDNPEFRQALKNLQVSVKLGKTKIDSFAQKPEEEWQQIFKDAKKSHEDEYRKRFKKDLYPADRERTQFNLEQHQQKEKSHGKVNRNSRGRDAGDEREVGPIGIGESGLENSQSGISQEDERGWSELHGIAQSNRELEGGTDRRHNLQGSDSPNPANGKEAQSRTLVVSGIGRKNKEDSEIRRQGGWIAEIEGPSDDDYVLKRKFVGKADFETGSVSAKIEEGKLYEVCEGSDQYFLILNKDGQYQTLSTEEAFRDAGVKNYLEKAAQVDSRNPVFQTRNGLKRDDAGTGADWMSHINALGRTSRNPQLRAFESIMSAVMGRRQKLDPASMLGIRPKGASGMLLNMLTSPNPNQSLMRAGLMHFLGGSAIGMLLMQAFREIDAVEREQDRNQGREI